MYECLLACIVVNADSTQQTGSRLLYSQLDTSGAGRMAGLDNNLVGSCDRAEAMSLGGQEGDKAEQSHALLVPSAWLLALIMRSPPAYAYSS